MSASAARTSGTLYIVATPIGHRDDISLRALNILKTVDGILAEDTRHSKPLLTLLGISKPMTSLHAHNEASKSEHIVKELLEGKSFALISDAGTPLISDPGYPLVKQARACAIPVVPIPGACALIAALSAAGVSCDTFTFSGFLPAKQAARQHKLEALLRIEHTLVFYESTHRILECLNDIALVFGEDCEVVLAKELTKTFERFITGTCANITQWLTSNLAHCKGEFVLIIPQRAHKIAESESTHILSILLAELPIKQAVKIACQLSETPKNVLYKMALNLNNKPL